MKIKITIPGPIESLIGCAIGSVICAIINTILGKDYKFSIYVIMFIAAYGALSVLRELLLLIINKFFKDEEYDDVISERIIYGEYHNGIAKVDKILVDSDENIESSSSNYVNEDGDIISDVWFDAADNFNEYGTSIVLKDGEYFIIDKGCNRISDKFSGISSTCDGKSKVMNSSGLINYVDVKTGATIWKSWKKEG